MSRGHARLLCHTDFHLSVILFGVSYDEYICRGAIYFGKNTIFFCDFCRQSPKNACFTNYLGSLSSTWMMSVVICWLLAITLSLWHRLSSANCRPMVLRNNPSRGVCCPVRPARPVSSSFVQSVQFRPVRPVRPVRSVRPVCPVCPVCSARSLDWTLDTQRPSMPLFLVPTSAMMLASIAECS